MNSTDQAEPRPETNRDSPLVFISHSHVDEETVREIYDLLRDLGTEPYATSVDRKEDFQREIGQKLSQCDVFLLIASKAAFQSEWVTEEIIEARFLKKPISYYRTEPASPPEEVARFLNRLQYIEAEPKNSKILEVAEDVLLKSCMPEAEAKKRINRTSQDLQNRYNQWRDRLWTYMYDCSSNRRKHRLSRWEHNKLNELASRLRIRISIKEELAGYKRNRKELVEILTSALSKESLEISDLKMLECKRIESCISIHETQNIVCKLSRLRSKAINIKIDEPASCMKHWLNDAVTQLNGNKSESEGVPSIHFQAPRPRKLFALKTTTNTWEYFYIPALPLLLIEPVSTIYPERDTAIRYSSLISSYYFSGHTWANELHINASTSDLSELIQHHPSTAKNRRKLNSISILCSNPLLKLWQKLGTESPAGIWIENDYQFHSCQLDAHNALPAWPPTQTDKHADEEEAIVNHPVNDDFRSENSSVFTFAGNGHELEDYFLGNKLKSMRVASVIRDGERFIFEGKQAWRPCVSWTTRAISHFSDTKLGVIIHEEGYGTYISLGISETSADRAAFINFIQSNGIGREANPANNARLNEQLDAIMTGLNATENTARESTQDIIKVSEVAKIHLGDTSHTKDFELVLSDDFSASETLHFEEQSYDLIEYRQGLPGISMSVTTIARKGDDLMFVGKRSGTQCSLIAKPKVISISSGVRTILQQDATDAHIDIDINSDSSDFAKFYDLVHRSLAQDEKDGKVAKNQQGKGQAPKSEQVKQSSGIEKPESALITIATFAGLIAIPYFTITLAWSLIKLVLLPFRALLGWH